MARKVNHDSKRQRRIRKQRQKENNPLLYFYNIKKQSAKQKNLDFELTFQQWCKLWNNDIVNLKNEGYTIDRKNPLKGYTKANTRLLSAYENSYNGATVDKDIHNGKSKFKDKKIEDEF
jgi:hypothetical protein